MRYFIVLGCYRLICLLLVPFLWAFLIVRSRKNRAYRKGIAERFGLLFKPLAVNGIVVHAASVGEVIAIAPFVNQLLEKFPHLPITVTTFTPTGANQVKKLFQDKVQHCYLPFDVMFAGYFFLTKLQPQLMVLMETELWPSLIRQCKNRNIRLMLINARLSVSSLNNYRRFNWLFSPTIQAFDKILTQSQVNQNHFLALGANECQCILSGNLKFDLSLTPDIDKKQQELKCFINTDRNIWLIASTHPGDEALVLAAFKKVIEFDNTALLIIVPRHPERFEEVINLAKKADYHVGTRSSKQAVTKSTQVWVMDSLGELLAATSFADVVTMGGSFSDIGGHNPLEPALYKKAIIVGSNMSNFSEILSQLIEANGIVQLLDNQNMIDSLAEQVIQLFTDKSYAQKLGQNAYHVVVKNQGATARTVAHLDKCINLD